MFYQICPNCGYCPHCGRGNYLPFITRSSFELPPYFHVVKTYPQVPYYPNWTINQPIITNEYSNTPEMSGNLGIEGTGSIPRQGNVGNLHSYGSSNYHLPDGTDVPNDPYTT